MTWNMIILVLCEQLISGIGCIMLRKECPLDEAHKSCSFTEEYTCWVNKKRMERVRTAPKRLPHCRSGCFCKKGYVREFLGGGCVVAAGCSNQRIRLMLNKLPVNKGLYVVNNVGRGV